MASALSAQYQLDHQHVQDAHRFRMQIEHMRIKCANAEERQQLLSDCSWLSKADVQAPFRLHPDQADYIGRRAYRARTYVVPVSERQFGMAWRLAPIWRYLDLYPALVAFFGPGVRVAGTRYADRCYTLRLFNSLADRKTMPIDRVCVVAIHDHARPGCMIVVPPLSVRLTGEAAYQSARVVEP